MKSLNKVDSLGFCRVLGVCAASLMLLSAEAAPKTWDGEGSATDLNWLTGANWDADTVPSAGDDLFFTVAAPVGTRVVTNNFAANTAFHDIVINATGGGYQLWGNAVNITGSVTNLANNPGVIQLVLSLQQDTIFSVASGQRLELTGDVTGSFGIIKYDAGNLRINGVQKTYTGSTLINGGMLDLVAGGIPNNTDVTVGPGATLQLNNFSQIIDGLSGSGTVTKTGSNTRTLTIGNNGEAGAVFAGSITLAGGSSGVTKVGTGRQVLSGPGTFSWPGATLVSAGTLQLSNNVAIAGAGTMTVAASAKLTGNGRVNGGTTINGEIAPGDSIGTLTFSNSLVLAGLTTLEIDRNNGQTADLVNVVGALTRGGTLAVTNIGANLQGGDFFNLLDWGSVSGSFTSTNLPSLDAGLSWDFSQWDTAGILSVAAIPEPSPVALALIGGAALLWQVRRRQS